MGVRQGSDAISINSLHRAYFMEDEELGRKVSASSQRPDEVQSWVTCIKSTPDEVVTALHALSQDRINDEWSERSAPCPRERNNVSNFRFAGLYINTF
jgi:hypothetical protein